MIRGGPRNAENAKRRFFYGPGINNFDLALRRVTKITESKRWKSRAVLSERLNRRKYQQPDFWHVLRAASPRIGQAALKFNF